MKIPVLHYDNDGNLIGKSEVEQLPVPPPEPTTEDDLMALVIDLEYRTTLLELGVI